VSHVNLSCLGVDNLPEAKFVPKYFLYQFQLLKSTFQNVALTS